jgi:hypothetical protein
MNTPNTPGQARIIPADETDSVFKQLAEVSEHYWGSEQYGVTARSYIESLWRVSRFSVYVDARMRDVSINSDLPVQEVDLFDSLRGQGLGGAGNSKLQEAFSAVLDSAPLPFYFDVVNAEDGLSLFWAYPCSLSRDKLAGYMKNRGLSRHTLHGTAGKSLDVLSAAAGVGEKTVVDCTDPGDYIGFTALLQKARDKGLKEHQTNLLKKQLVKAVLQQIRTGMPLEYGEVVLEGPFSVVSPAKSLEECSVAIASLGVLALGSTNNAIKAFLDNE